MLKIGALSALLALTSTLGMAQEVGNPPTEPANLDFSGYATLGAYRAEGGSARWRPDPSVPNSSHQGQWRWDGDSRVGAQLRWQALPQLELVGQVLAKDSLERRFRPGVEWAYLAWQASDNLSLRLGRQTLPVQLMSENKHVGYAHTMLRPPETVYLLNNGAPVDGLNFSWTRVLLGGTWSVDGGWGRAETQTGRGRFQVRRNASLVSTWQTDHWLLRAGYNEFLVDLQQPGLDQLFDPSDCSNCQQVFAQRASAQGMLGRMWTLGASWTRGPWSVSGEYTLRRSNTVLLSAARGWYVSLSHRFGPLTPYAWIGANGFDEAPLGLQPSNGASAAQQARLQMLDRYAQSPFDRRMLALGARWELTDRIALKLQAEWWRATRDQALGRLSDLSLAAPPLARPGLPAWDGRVHVRSLSLDYVY